MEYRPTKAARRKLFEIANAQGGYFTAKDAADAGYRYPHLCYHVAAGNFEREGHGLYRIRDIPRSFYDELVALTFWSRDRSGEPQGVVSHATALDIHDMSDLTAYKVHLTVPPTFRKKPPDVVVLHRARIDRRDVAVREGFFLTKPVRTLIDVAADPSVIDEHVYRAVEDALRRGLVSRRDLEQALAANVKLERLARALKYAHGVSVA